MVLDPFVHYDFTIIIEHFFTKMIINFLDKKNKTKAYPKFLQEIPPHSSKSDPSLKTPSELNSI